MKLLIVAGPYEADLIRRAAASGGIEAVAAEPGESLSRWISATRPEVIVMAPQIVSDDPVTALATVRAVPRGRVPIILLLDDSDDSSVRSLADAHLVRPVNPEDVLTVARELTALVQPRDDAGSGPTPSGRVVAAHDESSSGPLGSAPFPVSGPHVKTPTLRPLLAPTSAPAATPAAAALADPRTIDAFIDGHLNSWIEADVNAAIRELWNRVARPETDDTSAGALSISMDAEPGMDAALDALGQESLSGLKEESSEKTREVLDASQLVNAEESSGTLSDRRRRQKALSEDGDYFQILGLPPSANAEEIVAAHARLTIEFSDAGSSPDAAAADPLADMQIRKALDEAVRILGHDRLRRAYGEQILRHQSSSRDEGDRGNRSP